MKKFYIIILLLNFLFLSACATVKPVPMTKENRQTIKTVYVDPKIKKPDQMYEMAAGASVGYGFGLVGAIVAGAVNGNAAEKTQTFAEKNNINIQNIVYKKWQDQLNSKHTFKLTNSPNDAVLITEIENYGISVPHGFSNSYVPVLALNAKLVRNNQVIWQNREYITTLADGLPKYKMDEILKDPKKLYAMWDQASDRIINKLVTDMNTVA
jgi:hypothetical protein